MRASEKIKEDIAGADRPGELDAIIAEMLCDIRDELKEISNALDALPHLINRE